MARRRIGVGVVGLGWMGRLHSRSYRQLAERYPLLGADVELVAAADPVEGHRQEAVSSLGFKRAYSSFDELLEDPGVDVVSICSPNYLHREMALAAAHAGKPFWIEKPMGVSAEESAQIAQAAHDAGVVTAVGFNYRNAPAIEKARAMIAQGDLGRVTNVRCWLIADYASSSEGPLTWRYSRKQAGAGVLGDLLSHGVDLVQYLCGPIRSVCAMTDTFVQQRPIPLTAAIGHGSREVSSETGAVENEDYVALMARLESGVAATLESSRVAVGPRAEYVVEVYGTRGSIRWNFERMNELEVALEDDRGLPGYTRVMAGEGFPNFSTFQPSPGTSMGFDDLKTVEAAKFIESVVTGQQIAPSVDDGSSAAQIVDAAVKSVKDKRWHDVSVSG